MNFILKLLISCHLLNLTYSFAGDVNYDTPQGRFHLREAVFLSSRDKFQLKISSGFIDGEQMGYLEFTTPQFGKCTGEFHAYFNDEGFKVSGHAIESVNGLYCEDLEGSEYDWINFVLIFPKNIDLTDKSFSTRGLLYMRHHENRFIYKELVDIQKVDAGSPE